MLRSILAVTFIFLVAFPATTTLAASAAWNGAPLFDDIVSSLEAPGNLLGSDSRPARDSRYTLKPNTRFVEKNDLKSLCYSPVDSVEHYIGANIAEEQTGPADEAAESRPAEPDYGRNGWSVQLGAGVERRLSGRTAFDIDYRYTSTPIEFDLDAIRAPAVHEHNISAGMKFYF